MSGSPRQLGPLDRTLIRLFLKPAHVTEAESIADQFRLVTLESPAFKGTAWEPGQKLQVAMDSAFVTRTFTPVEWDARAGRTRLLGYLHGDAPGSNWLRSVRPGDECNVFGPRASIRVSPATSLRVVLGDETSIGLAYAFARHFLGGSVKCLLEVTNPAYVTSLLTQLHLDDVVLFERSTADAHLAQIERRLPALVASGAVFILTGKASSIQFLRRALKALGLPSSRLQVKAYWAPGKTGLD